MYIRTRSNKDWENFLSMRHTQITQRASHPRPPDFQADFWGNSRGSSLWKCPHNFRAEIQGKWRGIFYVDISASFPCRFPGDISTWKYLSCFPQHFKMQFNDIGRVPVVWRHPSDDLMSFFGELKCLQIWGNFPLISTPIWKFPLNFHMDARFTYNPNFHVDSLHQQPKSLGIPRRIC